MKTTLVTNIHGMVFQGMCTDVCKVLRNTDTKNRMDG